jgi:hypothetical protein
MDHTPHTLVGRGAGHPNSSPVRTRRAQLRQRAQDGTVDVAARSNPITAYGFRPIQLEKAGGERFTRRSPRYPRQWCGRVEVSLWWTSHVSPPRLISPRGLPSAGITRPPRYYAPSDFLAIITISLLLRLLTATARPAAQPGSPTFTYPLWRHAVLSDPGEANRYLPYPDSGDVVFWVLDPIDPPKNRYNGAQSLQPNGLRPAASLSTLGPWRYRHQPKTRYAMHWVRAFAAALSAASG